MSEWISVEDRLPKDDEKILVLLESWEKKRFLVSAIFQSDCGFEDCYLEVEDYVNSHSESCGILGGYRSPKITHWMPLPELPENE